MIVNNNPNLIYNIPTLVCIPKVYENRLSTYEYNFKYVYLFEPSYKSTMELMHFIKKNNIQELILVDYCLEYDMMIDKLCKDIRISSLLTFDLASLTNPYFLTMHNAILALYQNEQIKKIGVLDKNLYLVMKAKMSNVFHVFLDEEKGLLVKQKGEGIGVISQSDDPKNSFYNSLSAIKLKNRKTNLAKMSPDVIRFIKQFKVDCKEWNDINQVIMNSSITMYINFCNSNNSLFLKSMDIGVPCIIGNNDILEDCPELKSRLQVESDDDIDEIANKIEEVEKTKNEILQNYESFRYTYTQKSKKSIDEFCINPIHRTERKKYEKLLTIGIPVYNVEDYLDFCLNSVLKAIPNKQETEILIVNDGSTDHSEEVILKYQAKEKELIRYIKQDNHGLGNVRNVILENAKGKYIASIDSDDTIHESFFRESWEYLKNDIDIVMCDWLSIMNENSKFTTEAMDGNLNFENQYKKILYSTIMPSTCNKIIKKELYDTLSLQFIEGLKFEDLGTNPIIMKEAETIYYIHKPYYEYNIRQNSIMRTNVGYHMIDVLRLLEDRVNFYIKDKDFNKKEFIAYVYFWRIEESIINPLYTLNKEERNRMYEYTKQKIGDILEQTYKENCYVDFLIDRVDTETKEYIHRRNQELLDGNFEKFLEKAINKKEYKILTPALILYNYDNR